MRFLIYKYTESVLNIYESMDVKTQELLIHSMVREINNTVRRVWTQEELEGGKPLIFLWEDLDIVRKVIPLFVEKGWIIKKKQALCESSGRKIIVHITKPPYEESTTYHA